MLTTVAVCADSHFFHCPLHFYFQKIIKNAFRPLGTKDSFRGTTQIDFRKRKPSLCICYADKTCGSNNGKAAFFRKLRSVFHKSFRYRTFTTCRLSARKTSNYSLHQSKIYYTIYYILFFANVKKFLQKYLKEILSYAGINHIAKPRLIVFLLRI